MRCRSSLQRISDSEESEIIRSLGYLNFCGTGRSIISTGGCVEIGGIAGAEGGVHSLKQPVDGLAQCQSTQSCFG